MKVLLVVLAGPFFNESARSCVVRERVKGDFHGF
jgi:hypothetical protein